MCVGHLNAALREEGGSAGLPVKLPRGHRGPRRHAAASRPVYRAGLRPGGGELPLGSRLAYRGGVLLNQLPRKSRGQDVLLGRLCRLCGVRTPLPAAGATPPEAPLGQPA